MEKVLIKKKKRKKGKKNKKFQGVNYSMPYEGTEGISMSRETAKNKWESKASADELKLGLKLTQDSAGNFIARSRLQSKA